MRMITNAARAVVAGLMVCIYCTPLLASPRIEYGNLDANANAGNLCDPDLVYAALQYQIGYIPPVDLVVRGISARIPFKVEERREVGTHGFTRNGGGKFHGGTDLIGDIGEEVLAIIDGEIVAAVNSQGKFGNYIILRTSVIVPPALPCAVDIVYAHLSVIDVSSGVVVPGQPIGRVGRSGISDDSIPTHLHIELWAAAYAQGLQNRILRTRDIMPLFGW